jgi:diaminopimelate decarboxylase
MVQAARDGIELLAPLLTDESPAALLYDLEALRRRFSELAQAFVGALNTVAVKACPLPSLLAIALESGLGLEVASEGEVALAVHLGADPARVVFDSPAKTQREIAQSLRLGHRLNVDNWQELERVAQWMESGAFSRSASTSIGLRVNPEVYGAQIEATFTGGPGSKFGVSLESDRGAILAAFAEYPWLDGLHVHTGSQGVPLSVLVEGVRRAFALAGEIAERGRAPKVIDIGGGLPARYRPTDAPPTFADYAAALRAQVPEFASGRFQLLTEFGRALFAGSAVAVSRVEYTRPGPTAVVHFGADLFLRAVYRPDDWFHALDVRDRDGVRKRGPLSPWSVAGPLCFSGDFIARDRRLPPIVPGDLVVVHDVGAYTLAMWSRYNSRPMPAVYGLEHGVLRPLKPRETVDEVVRFWR